MAKEKSTEKTKPIRKRVYLGIKDGKMIYKNAYGKTQDEADEKALQIKLSMRKGIDVTADRDSFGTWAKRWLRTKKGDVSTGRYLNYSHRVDTLDSISFMPITQIRTSDIQDIIDDLAEENPTTHKPTAKKTLKDVQSVISQIFKLAIENRVVEYNPALYVRIPKYAPSESRRALDDKEQEWITDTPHRMQTGAMIMMYAGPKTWQTDSPHVGRH